MWWLMSVMPALGRLRWEDGQEFKASLGYIGRLTKIKREKKKERKKIEKMDMNPRHSMAFSDRG